MRSFYLFAICCAAAPCFSDELIRLPESRFNKPAGHRVLEVHFLDDSKMRVQLREERIEIRTPHGPLSLPIGDIQKIEFGTRISSEMAKRIDAAVADLGNMNYRKRETATALLLAMKERSFPAVQAALKNPDAEVVQRAEELVRKLQETIPEDKLRVRDYDIITTELSRFAGRIETDLFKASTTQFGEVTIKLADVASIRSINAEPEKEIGEALADPGALYHLNNQIGKTFTYRVTGTATGSVWGTDIYTTDSLLAATAVHAGLLRNGQTGIVKVTILPSPVNFVGSVRNGITSANYPQYPAAYRVHR